MYTKRWNAKVEGLDVRHMGALHEVKKRLECIQNKDVDLIAAMQGVGFRPSPAKHDGVRINRAGSRCRASRVSNVQWQGREKGHILCKVPASRAQSASVICTFEYFQLADRPDRDQEF